MRVSLHHLPSSRTSGAGGIGSREEVRACTHARLRHRTHLTLLFVASSTWRWLSLRAEAFTGARLVTRLAPKHAFLATWIAVALLASGNVYLNAQASTATPVPPTVVPVAADDIPRAQGPLTIQPMKFRDQARFYLKHTYDPGSLFIPALPSAIIMADPPKRYPRAWKDGGQAFGRNFGDAFAVQTAANTAKFLAGSFLREDPRYFPDTKRAVTHRILYALSFTVVDRSTGGRPRLALSNFAGAAAGGFVGRAYLPDGYSDNIHAGQRSAGLFVGYIPTQLVGYATGNVISEFSPEFKALGKALHIPFVH